MGRLERFRALWVPALLLLCVTLPHLGQGDWQRTDTGWYSAIAVQAWRTGELWTLHAQPGHPYFNKPPLVFWIHGLVMHVLGAGAWQARLPSVAAAMACVLLTVSLARRFAGWHASMAAGIVLALSLEFFRRTREISLDLWQLAFMLGAARIAVEGTVRGGVRWFAAAGVPVGLALWCKPIMGLVVPVMMGAWTLWNRAADRGAARSAARGIGGVVAMTLVALAVAAPWHVSMVLTHGREFTDQYFGREIASRASGERSFSGGGDKPAWFYVAQIARAYWPWMLAFVPACVAAARGSLRADARLVRWAVVWGVGWLVLLTLFPDRRDRYAVVLYPAMAVLCGLWLTRRASPRPDAPIAQSPGADASVSITGVIRRHWPLAAAAGAAVFAVLPVRVHRPIDPQWPALFAWLREHGSPDLWEGSFSGPHGSRLYLEFGRWPTTTRDRHGTASAGPPPGALVIYHDDDGPGPRSGDPVLFSSGELRVVSRAAP